MAVKVLHVVRPVKGGMKKHLEILFGGLDPERYLLYLAAPPGSELFTDLHPFIKGKVPVPIEETWHSLRNWQAIHTLSRVIRVHNIDLVHTHGIMAGAIGQTAALFAGCGRVVATVHNFLNPGTPFFGAYRSFLALLARISISHMITVSDALKLEIQRLKWLPEDRITVVYNGLDACDYRVEVEKPILRKALGIPGVLPVVGTVARLEPNKGVRFFLEAAKHIDKEYGPVYLLVVGDGPEREFLQSLAGGLGLAGRVLFIGFRNDVPRLLPLLDVAVIPSLKEGLSIFCLEALAAGRPVVASAVGGLPELIQHGRTGLLVPPGDSGALARAIVTLLRNRVVADTLGRRGREMVAGRFTREQMLAGTIKVYEMVLRNENNLWKGRENV